MSCGGSEALFPLVTRARYSRGISYAGFTWLHNVVLWLQWGEGVGAKLSPILAVLCGYGVGVDGALRRAFLLVLKG